jgi:hypothetical protein
MEEVVGCEMPLEKVMMFGIGIRSRRIREVDRGEWVIEGVEGAGL